MVLSLTHQALLLKIWVLVLVIVLFPWTGSFAPINVGPLSSNIVVTLLILGGVVVSSSNFTSLGNSFSSYHGIVSLDWKFFLFLYFFFVKLTLAVTLGWTDIPSDGGDITPKFLSGIIISP